MRTCTIIVASLTKIMNDEEDNDCFKNRHYQNKVNLYSVEKVIRNKL